MASTPVAPSAPAAHNRLSVAPRSRALSLGTRLALSVACAVAIVITGLTVIGMRLAEQRLEDDLRETARVAAAAVADDVELRPEPVTSAAIAHALHEFLTAAPSLQSISVFRADAAGISLVGSTSSAPAPPAAFVRTAIESGEAAWQVRTANVAAVAVPIFRGDATVGAVAVTVSLAAVEQLRRWGRVFAVGGSAVAIAGITLLIHLLTRRLVLAPVQEMHRAIHRVAAGDLGARAEVGQPGELGELAAGLNHMVAQLDDLHRSLNQRVEAATEELRQRNTQLMRSYESILDLRETAAHAQQLAAVGQTMANVAHQIGTPLNLVSGHVQLLRQELTDSAVQRRLAVVQGQVERVAAVMRGLLERARPETERKPVAVGALVTRLADAMRPRLSKAGIALNLDVAPSLPEVLADETQLELALLNIVTNAVDAMPHGGALIVGATAADTGLRIEIRDTGSGIAPELLAKIFEPWVTTKATGRGTGLGLSITRDVVAGLGGAITARSEPGQGAAFIIELPGAPVAAHESRG